LEVTKGDLIASAFVSLFITGFVGLAYDIRLAGWPLLTTIALLFFLASFYILRNQRNNQKKWEKRPITFPNPEGGGILGQYMERPWQNELAELGRRYNKKKRKSK
jgi:hypothetical protein